MKKIKKKKTYELYRDLLLVKHVKVKYLSVHRAFNMDLKYTRGRGLSVSVLCVCWA